MAKFGFREAGRPFFNKLRGKGFQEASAPFQSGVEPHYHHHRKRLREKFITRGKDALADYEIMELILFRTIPYKDVKPLAKRILEHFGNDFNRALSAKYAELIEIVGVGEAVATEIKIVEAAAHKLAQARVLNHELISSWDALMDYCTTVMAHRETEQFRILYLNNKNILIADEAQAEGTVDHVPVYPREVVRRALALNASAIILVHNHPTGDPTPSQADIDMTRTIELAVNSVGIELHDHVVIGKGSQFSFRSEGHL